MKRLKKKQANRVYSSSDVIARSETTKRSLFLRLLRFARNDINRVLFLVFVFFLPTQLGKHFFPSFSYLNGVRVDYLAPTVYFTDILVFFLFLFNLKTVINFFKNKKLLLVLGLLMVNVVLAKNQGVALYQLIKIVEFLIVFSLGQQLFKIIKEKAALAVLFLTGIFQLSLAMLQLLLRHSVQGVFYFFGERLLTLTTPGVAKATVEGVEFLRPYATFSHPNSMAGFFLLLYFFVLTYKNFNRYMVLKYLVLFIFACLVFVSFSKVAILTFLILNTFYAFVSFPRKRAIVPLGESRFSIESRMTVCKPCRITRIVVPVLISAVFLRATTDVATVEKRLELVKNSLDIIFKNPLFGVGLGNYLIAQSEFRSKYLLFFNQPVHNIFLLFISEAGIIVAAFLLLEFFLPAGRHGKTFITSEQAFIILVVILTGLFDHYWLTLEQNFLLLAFIYGSVSRAFFISKLRLRRAARYS